MSKYTTGEIARLCGVSVRTVQYYDERGILVPGTLTEGGRRLYSDDDLRRMHIICFLREAGISISGIAQLLHEDKPEDVISLLLEQQEQMLREELSEREQKLQILAGIKRELKEVKHFSVDSIGDIAHIMKQKNKRTKMLWIMVLTGIPVTALQWVAIILGITHGLWWLLGVWVCVSVSWGIIGSTYYYKHIDFICPACHKVFRPMFKEMFWAYHTPKMRRLTCPHCQRRGMCVEIYAENKNMKSEGRPNG